MVGARVFISLRVSIISPLRWVALLSRIRLLPLTISSMETITWDKENRPIMAGTS